MNIKGPLVSGTFIERPNRFITLVKVNQRTIAGETLIAKK